jgi:hypothetical protein
MRYLFFIFLQHPAWEMQSAATITCKSWPGFAEEKARALVSWMDEMRWNGQSREGNWVGIRYDLLYIVYYTKYMSIDKGITGAHKRDVTGRNNRWVYGWLQYSPWYEGRRGLDQLSSRCIESHRPSILEQTRCTACWPLRPRYRWLTSYSRLEGKRVCAVLQMDSSDSLWQIYTPFQLGECGMGGDWLVDFICSVV